MLPPVQRTLQLLESLLHAPEGISIRELLAQTDASRSTLFAMLRTLKTLGYAEQSARRGIYRPGPRLLAWRSLAGGASQEVLDAFYREAPSAGLDETLALFTPAAGRALLLGQIESSRRVRSVFPPGAAFTPPESASAALLIAPDEETRSRGYALRQDTESLEIALPVCADGVHPSAALACTAPRARFAPDSLPIHTLRTLAARISYRIGAPLYAPFQRPGLPPLGPTTPLPEVEQQALLREPWAARLVCLRPDGAPHIVPVWHEWDGRAFHLPAWEGSRWADYLRANPHLSLSVDEPWPPLRRVVARGQAFPLPLGEESETILRRISRRYLGDPHPPRRVTTIFRMEPASLKGWRN